MTTIIINLVGKSASGKNFHKSRFLYSTNENIVNLLKKHHVVHIVSTTTRAIRPGEVEGEDYYYVSVEEHIRLRNEGQIFEEVSLGTTKYSHCKSSVTTPLLFSQDLGYSLYTLASWFSIGFLGV